MKTPKIKRLSLSGFGHIEMLFVLVVIVAIAGIGYYVVQSKNASNTVHAGSWTKVAAITSVVHTVNTVENKCQSNVTGRADGVKNSFLTNPVNGQCPALVTLTTKNVAAVPAQTIAWCNPNPNANGANPAGVSPIKEVFGGSVKNICSAAYVLGTKTIPAVAAKSQEWCTPNALGTQAGLSSVGFVASATITNRTNTFACPALLSVWQDSVPTTVDKGTLTVFACEENATTNEDSQFGPLWIVKTYATANSNAQKYAPVSEPGTKLALDKLSLQVYRPGQPADSAKNRDFTVGGLHLVQSPTPVALTSANDKADLATSDVIQTFASQLRYGTTAAKLKLANAKSVWENDAVGSKNGQGTNGVGDQFRISLINSQNGRYYPDSQSAWNFQSGPISPQSLSPC